MLNTNITSFRKDIYNLLEKTIKYNEPVNVNTKDGNVVVISEDEYRSMMETLYLTSMPGMREKILDGMAQPLCECIPEEEVDW